MIHLIYGSIIVILLALLVWAAVSRREYRSLWLYDEDWIAAHYTGAGTSEYDALRAGDVGHPIGGRK